jgi:hypothetical protein
MTRHQSISLLAHMALAAIAGGAANAQVTTAAINGSVRDSSGAPLERVAIRVSNDETGYARSMVSGSDGSFHAPLLPLGPYTVTAEAAGFSRYVQRGVRLELNQNARLDLVLAIGNLQETISVTASAPIVDTAGSSAGAVIEERTIRELPLNGRNPIQLAALTPGVATISAPTILTWTGRTGGQLTVHGSRANENGYLLDGGYFTGIYQQNGMNYPAPDALAEFKLITNSFSAEYGRMVGSIFNAVTKSGTNEVHGALWEFLRNDALNARNFFAPNVPVLRQNQFGAAAGGPLKPNRVFLFGSYQGTRIREQRLLGAFPATAQERAGQIRLPAGRLLRDPRSGQPFPVVDAATNTYFVDPARFNPIAARVLNSFVPVPPGTAQYITLAGSPSNNDQYLIKGDADVTKSDRVTVSFFRDRTRFTDPARGSSFIHYSETNNRADVWNASLADVHSVSPRLISEARLHYLRDYSFWDSPNKLTPGELGLQNYPQEGHPEPPTFNVSSRFTLGAGGNALLGELGYRWEFGDTCTWIHNSHNVKFGGLGMRSHWGIRTASAAPGSFSFTGAITNDALTDFLLGLPSQLQRGAAIYKDHVSWSGAWFVQDDWRVTRTLTLNLGYRYEINGPFASKDARGTVFRPGQRSTVVPGLPEGMLAIGDPGVPGGIFRTDRNNLAPRIGLAWDPFGSGKTAVRANGGLFYGMSDPDLTTQPGSNPPWATRSILFSPPGGLTNPYLGFQNPFPYHIDPRNPVLAPPQTLISTAADFRDPTIYSWMFSAQRQLIADVMVEAAYVGKSSTGLNMGLEANPAIFVPGRSTAANINDRRIYYAGRIGPVTESAAAGHSTYHGLDVSGRMRNRHGLSLTAAYTWSKSIDGFSNFAHNVRGNQNPFDRRADKGVSDFDRTHVLSLSWVYDTPKVSPMMGNSRVAATIVDGWEFSGIARMVSGAPFSVTMGTDNSLTGVNLDRPNLTGEPAFSSDRPRSEQVARWFNTAAFTAPPLGSYGNAGRNILRGPGTANVDLGLFKTFRLGSERAGRLQFRAELFNVLNRVNFSNPNAALNAGANFGRITVAGAPRIAQFGLKYLF